MSCSMSSASILTVHRLDALFMFHEHEQCTRRWSMVPFHAIGAGFKKKKKEKEKEKKREANVGIIIPVQMLT